MTAVIIAALALTLLQLWIIPAGLSGEHVKYLLSSRDGEAPEDSVLKGRVSRAGANLQESLPAFLVLSVLAVVQQVDLVCVAQIWLASRVAFLACYMFNVIYVRTLVWFVSIGCLVYMAYQLV